MGFVVLRSMIRGAVQWITNLYFLNLFNLSDKDLDVTFICILFDSSKSLFQKNKISERLTMLFWGGKKTTTTKNPPKNKAPYTYNTNDTYHFLHKLVMYGVFHKQSPSSDAVFSLVEKH